MSDVYVCPLPNTPLDGSIVIGSSYHSDGVGIVVLLNPQPPYFTVAYVTEEGVERLHSEFNIVGIAKAYVDHGGDPGDAEGAFDGDFEIDYGSGES